MELDGYAASYPLSTSFVKAARKKVDEINDTGGEINMQIAEFENDRMMCQVTVVGDEDSVKKFNAYMHRLRLN